MISTEQMKQQITELLSERKFDAVRELFKESRVVDMADPIGEMDVKDILLVLVSGP